MENKLHESRHSAEHVLTQAMKNLGYKFHMAMGPATDDGFYFDFELLEGTISEDDFPKIEKEIEKIIKLDLPITEHEINADDARKLFKDNPYKQEWIDEIISNESPLTIYWIGTPDAKDSFVDLCKGPHVNSTKEIGVVKLLSIAGAYWRGSEKNKMLTRIYGTAFETKKELEEYLEKKEKQSANDHRILGKKLDLFAFSDLVGKGFVMYTPKGTIIKNELKNALVAMSKKYGVLEVNIPHLAKIDLYKISGHADKFSDELFRVTTHYDEEFVLKPVNCPHHTQIYASKPRSYRDLPIRYIESTQQHRDEKPGAIGGLNRTRSFEIDDGHTFCTPNQIKQEVINTIKIVEEFYTGLGMWGKHWVSLSFSDPNTPEKYIGEPKDWQKAEEMLQQISDELKLNAKVMIGEAALYGPKIDFMLKDVQGNDRQLATVQVDFAMPKRFELTYTDEGGVKKTPVMMHRAILGSYGRFIANLIESTGGAFPVWLSPVQVMVIAISEKSFDYAKKIESELNMEDIRVESDLSSETMGNKIRKAGEQKVPYMLIIGEKEAEAKTVSIRTRDGKQKNNVDLKTFTSMIKTNIMTKSLEVNI
ncbi:threonine--tRNA ligase [candidate division WWE3 bacterium CG_4_9_14_0_2_um_filter_35_11]|uniref:Threonine--tRNA ligase n=1 Tax=candidate division WWE3 bacterium CG_4_9_14_0_2_um_filter_35_11 TaxID=1975077 RepID=A0A2M8EL60_UNCKA|nr:MAG: threonine--tRNA ligase [candidate division WWE3 bacterium CG10_big_fil_rev_8_21_14_0_10_35_32]PJC23484.1 MAG: threonine--tRNA ligase [candidate division WWE3 bacterium CG_4_9_14_0_2_um_filter_35_11]